MGQKSPTYLGWLMRHIKRLFSKKAVLEKGCSRKRLFSKKAVLEKGCSRKRLFSKKAVLEKGIQDDGFKTRCSYKPIIIGNEIDLVLRARHVSAITARTRVPVDSGEVDADASWRQLAGAYRLPSETDATLVLKNEAGGLVGALRSMLPRAQKVDDYDKIEVDILDIESGNVETYNLINNRLKSEISAPLLGGSNAIDADVLVTLMEQDFDVKIQQIEW